jgi:catechol 2,3-dioxygenase-like lactoylglutathione lyase family enzyme
MGIAARELNRLAALAAVVLAAASLAATPPPQSASLAPPGFHHLHLNTVNPEAAIAFYTQQFRSTSATRFAGELALSSPNTVLVLFTRVNRPPATEPPSAFWHFGWHVTSVRERLAAYLRSGVTLLPLYDGDGGTVFVSSDTWPGTGGVLGLTREGIADAKAKGVKPAGGAGFAYLRGPDDALVEYQGDMPAERFNHVHMFQDQPFCAELWYEEHLHAPVVSRAGQARRTAQNCRVERSPARTFPALHGDGMFRTPSVTSVRFGDISFFWYMNQGEAPAVSTRGQLMDHVALSVPDLDSWIAKLRAENVTFLEQPYVVGAHRAIMIEGPSREAIEIIEVQ